MNELEIEETDKNVIVNDLLTAVKLIREKIEEEEKINGNYNIKLRKARELVYDVASTLALLTLKED